MNDVMRRIQTKRHIGYIKDRRDSILHRMRWHNR